MSKVSAAEMDALILLVARLSLRQLERVDDIVHQAKMRKLDGKDEAKEATV